MKFAKIMILLIVLSCLSSTLAEAQVNLAWDPTPPPVAGYNIFRTPQCGNYPAGIGALVNNALIITTTFTDPTPLAGTSCYVVASVGTCMNQDGTTFPCQSAFSNEVTVTMAALTCPAGQFLAQYYAGQFIGTPLASRCEPNINNDWGDGIPIAGVPADGFSVRWTCVCGFNAGPYTFTMSTDDGMRVFLDGAKVIDSWMDQGTTAYSASVPNVSAGNHNLVVEYYENGGGAVAKMSWAPVVTPPTNLKVTFVTPQNGAIVPFKKDTIIQVTGVNSTQIQLYQATNLLITVQGTSLTYIWTPKQRKSFSFTAKAKDASGMTTSTSITVTAR